jgi:hypothetical protein
LARGGCVAHDLQPFCVTVVRLLRFVLL